MTAIRLLLAALALAATASAAAQEEGITALRIKPGVCTATKSRPQTVGALVAAQNDLNGQCVRITGVAAGGMLYDDQADARSSSTATRVGLYGDPKFLDALPENPTQMDFVGRVDTCDGRPFFVGYCHHVVDGVILIVSEVRRPNHEVD